MIPRGGVQRSDVDTFLAQYKAEHQIDKQGDNKAILAVGPDHWTLPIPLTKATNGWRFDLKAGSAEIHARRIGRNELAIAVGARLSRCADGLRLEGPQRQRRAGICPADLQHARQA
jgi:hypothetical protein